MAIVVGTGDALGAGVGSCVGAGAGTGVGPAVAVGASVGEEWRRRRAGAVSGPPTAVIEGAAELAAGASGVIGRLGGKRIASAARARAAATAVIADDAMPAEGSGLRKLSGACGATVARSARKQTS